MIQKSEQHIQDPVEQQYCFTLLQFSLDYESLKILEVSTELTVSSLETQIKFIDDSISVLLEKVDKRLRHTIMNDQRKDEMFQERFEVYWAKIEDGVLKQKKPKPSQVRESRVETVRPKSPIEVALEKRVREEQKADALRRQK